MKVQIELSDKLVFELSKLAIEEDKPIEAVINEALVCAIDMHRRNRRYTKSDMDVEGVVQQMLEFVPVNSTVVYKASAIFTCATGIVWKSVDPNIRKSVGRVFSQRNAEIKAWDLYGKNTGGSAMYVRSGATNV